VAVSLHDSNALSAAYRDFAPAAVRVAAAVLHDRAAAEDVVQDVFLELWQGKARFERERGTLDSYVTMLARSRALDRWRSRSASNAAASRLFEHVRATQPGMIEGPEDGIARRERVSETMRALATIPSEQREALLLAYAGGMSAGAVADACGVPLGTAKGRIRLGLANLRREVGASPGV
jgi:RNA polymerase sigma-70 factor, ECF subfamily